MANRIYSIILAGWVVCALFASPELQAEVQGKLDRSRITEGETVTLTITTDDARQSLETDFSPLEQDFAILDRRTETQLSIVNGRQTAVVRLVLTLEPRSAGTFLIPELHFGKDTTQPIGLQVEPAPEPEPGSQPPVFIEVELVPAEGPWYVHAQLGLVVRVFYQQNLTEAAISPPEPSPASVRLMQETPYQAERNGERYRVLERTYAVFPERSGELSIPPMQLTGRLVERRSSSVWQPAVRGRRVQIQSDPLQLEIEPKPPEFSGGEWQPARDYRLTQQISSGDALRVGEPVTRTVIIDAVGLEENMIVEPPWPEIPDTRIYPDQPQGITRDDGQWVLGHKEFRYAVVPEQEGELILPELSVEWWDTQNNQTRTAVLPAHSVYVQPSALAPPLVAPAEPAANGPVAAWPQKNGPAGHSYWRWLALVFATLWLVTLIAAWKLNDRKSVADKQPGREMRIPEKEAEALVQIKKACKSGDRRQARRALQAWLLRFGPREANRSLLEFAGHTGDTVIRDSIYALDAQGFQPGGQPEQSQEWDGDTFWKSFEKWRLARSNTAAKTALSDLYAPENRLRS